MRMAHGPSCDSSCMPNLGVGCTRTARGWEAMYLGNRGVGHQGGGGAGVEGNMGVLQPLWSSLAGGAGTHSAVVYHVYVLQSLVHVCACSRVYAMRPCHV